MHPWQLVHQHIHAQHILTLLSLLNFWNWCNQLAQCQYWLCKLLVCQQQDSSIVPQLH